MGTTNSKKIDASGEVNNIIQVSPDSPVSIEAGRLEILLVIQISLVAASLIYQFYKDHRRGWTKRMRRITTTGNIDQV